MRKFITLLVVVAGALCVFGTVSKKADANSLAGKEQKIDPTPFAFTSPDAGGAPIASKTKQSDVISGKSYKNDTSIPLRDMRPDPYLGKAMDREANENPKIPHSKHIDTPDEAIQDKSVSLTSLLAPLIPSPILTFDGIVFPGVGCNCAPPDTDGEVGQTQYAQMVNEAFQVFNKSTGASVFGPVGITTLWNGFGGVCETNGSALKTIRSRLLTTRDQRCKFWTIAVIPTQKLRSTKQVICTTSFRAAK